MMRVSKTLGSFIAMGAALVALTSTTDSRADGEATVTISCASGNVTVNKVQGGGYHLNSAAPWRWDKGEKVSVTNDVAVFKGGACAGTVNAYVCNDDQSQCKSFKLAVK